MLLNLAITAASLLIGCDKADEGTDPNRHSVCVSRARLAATALDSNGYFPSKGFVAFTSILKDLGSPFGVPRDIEWDGFEEQYRLISGASPWENEAARAAHDQELDRCLAGEGLTPQGGTDEDIFLPRTAWRDLSPIQQSRIVCTASVLWASSKSVDLVDPIYTDDFDQFVANDGDSEPTLATEQAYAAATARSPFRNPSGVEAFRLAARSC